MTGDAGQGDATGGGTIHAPRAPRTLRDGRLAPSSLAQVVHHPRTHLLPFVLLTGLVGLVPAGVTVLATHVLPAYHDGEFTFHGRSTLITVVLATTAALLATLLVLASAAATLHAAAAALGRAPRRRAVRRELVRRWRLLLVWAVAGVVVGAAVWALLVVLPLVDLLNIPLLITAAALATPVLLVPPTALVHGIGLAAAARHLATVRAHREADRELSHATNVVTAVAAVLVIGGWGVSRALGAAPTAAAQGLGVGALMLVAPAAFAVTCTALVRSLLGATSWVEPTDPAAYPWIGLDRVSQAPDVAPAPPSAAHRALAWIAALAVVAVVPLGAPLVAATNPTPAIHPRVDSLDTWFEQPHAVTLADGVLILDSGVFRPGDPESLTWCPDDAPCRSASADARAGDGWRLLDAAADPAGGVVIAAAGSDGGLVVAGCEPDACTDEDLLRGARTLPVQVAPEAPFSDAHAAGGTYAFVVLGVGEGGYSRGPLQLVRCADVGCSDADVVELAEVRDDGVATVRVTPDGTVLALYAATWDGVATLVALPPGSTSPVVLLEIPATRTDIDPGGGRAALSPIMELRGDAPVILHRDAVLGTLHLVSCSDTLCTEHTTTDLDIAPEVSYSQDMVIDATGRPVITTSAEPGLLLHSCTDPTCTDVRTGLMWPGNPNTSTHPYFIGRYLTLDAHDRPVALTSGRDNAVVRCEQPRCGL